MKDIDKKNRVFIRAYTICGIIMCLCGEAVCVCLLISILIEDLNEISVANVVLLVMFIVLILSGMIFLIYYIRQTAVFGADGIEARRGYKVFFIRTEKIPYSEICKIELHYHVFHYDLGAHRWYAKIYYDSSTERKTINIDISGNGTKLIELFVKYIPKVNYFIIGDVPSDHLELLYKLHIHDKRNVL